jgi:hypothetical protein
MKVLNLTQHAATADQIAAGVVDVAPEHKQRLEELLTFHAPPKFDEIQRRADELAELAESYGANDAMIGGAPWLMSALESALMDKWITPCYSFSVRDCVEREMPDGSVQKVNRFKHVAFV